MAEKIRVLVVGGKPYDLSEEFLERFEVVKHVEQDQSVSASLSHIRVDYVLVLTNWVEHASINAVKNRVSAPIVFLNKGWVHQKRELERRGILTPDAPAPAPAAVSSVPVVAPASGGGDRDRHEGEEADEPPKFAPCGNLTRELERWRGIRTGPYESLRVLAREARKYAEFSGMSMGETLKSLDEAVEKGVVAGTPGRYFVNYCPEIALRLVDVDDSVEREKKEGEDLPGSPIKSPPSSIPFLSDEIVNGVWMEIFSDLGYLDENARYTRAFWDEDLSAVTVMFDYIVNHGALDKMKSPGFRRDLARVFSERLGRDVSVKISGPDRVTVPPGDKTHKVEVVDVHVFFDGPEVVFKETTGECFGAFFPMPESQAPVLELISAALGSGDSAVSEFVRLVTIGNSESIEEYMKKTLVGKKLRILGHFIADCFVCRGIYA